MIAIEVSSAAGRPPWGGIGGTIRAIVGELLRIDTETRYALCHRFSRWRRGHPYDPGAPNARVRVIQDPFNALLLPGCRLMHAMGAALPTTPRVPRIATIHDLNAVRNPQWCSEDWHRKRSARFRNTVDHADCIVTPSRFMAEEIRDEYGLPAERVHVIGHGVDPQRYHPVDDDTRRRVRARHGDYLLAIGLLTPRKNFVRLIEALPQVKDLGLVLVGRGSDGEADVEAALDRCGVRDRVTRLAGLEHDDLLGLLGGARACCVPSLYEGYGLSALEALACGTPLVCSNAASLPEVVGDAALLVDATRPDEIADALNRVTRDETLAATLRERGLERARAATWEASARSHRALYRDVAGV